MCRITPWFTGIPRECGAGCARAASAWNWARQGEPSARRAAQNTRNPENRLRLPGDRGEEPVNIVSEKQIPLLDLGAQHRQIRDEVLAAIVRVVDSQKFILGEEVKNLQAEIASYSGTKHAIGCASGSDALMLALMALDVHAGDEVLTTPYTFFATAGAISRVGAVAGFCGRRRRHVQPGREPDGKRPGGASQGSSDHSGALVWRLCRDGPHHEDGGRARD